MIVELTFVKLVDFVELRSDVDSCVAAQTSVLRVILSASWAGVRGQRAGQLTIRYHHLSDACR